MGSRLGLPCQNRPASSIRSPPRRRSSQLRQRCEFRFQPSPSPGRGEHRKSFMIAAIEKLIAALRAELTHYGEMLALLDQQQESAIHRLADEKIGRASCRERV